MKERLRNHIVYYWWTYLISAVLIIMLWTTLFSKLAEPKANEQINITYIGSAFDHVKLQSDLQDVIPELSEQNIKRVSVENAGINGEYELNTILRARLAGNCDFIIIEGKVLEDYKLDLASYFAEVDADTLTQYFVNCENITEDNKTYGITLPSECKLHNYYLGKSDLKVFFNKNSVNLSDLFDGIKEQNAALEILKYLAEAKDV